MAGIWSKPQRLSTKNTKSTKESRFAATISLPLVFFVSFVLFVDKGVVVKKPVNLMRISPNLLIFGEILAGAFWLKANIGEAFSGFARMTH